MRQLKITKQVTNRDTPSLDKYLQEIGRVDLISPEDEVILARKIKSGDADALSRHVERPVLQRELVERRPFVEAGRERRRSGELRRFV